MSIREKCLAAALGRQGRHDLSWANGLDTLRKSLACRFDTPRSAKYECNTRATQHRYSIYTWWRGDESRKLGRVVNLKPVDNRARGRSLSGAEHDVRRTCLRLAPQTKVAVGDGQRSSDPSASARA